MLLGIPRRAGVQGGPGASASEQDGFFEGIVFRQPPPRSFPRWRMMKEEGEVGAAHPGGDFRYLCLR